MLSRPELIDRIWERDPTVWTGADEAKWLGWLDEPSRMRERAAELSDFADAYRRLTWLGNEPLAVVVSG